MEERSVELVQIKSTEAYGGGRVTADARVKHETPSAAADAAEAAVAASAGPPLKRELQVRQSLSVSTAGFLVTATDAGPSAASVGPAQAMAAVGRDQFKPPCVLAGPASLTRKPMRR